MTRTLQGRPLRPDETASGAPTSTTPAPVPVRVGQLTTAAETPLFICTYHDDDSLQASSSSSQKAASATCYRLFPSAAKLLQHRQTAHACVVSPDDTEADLSPDQLVSWTVPHPGSLDAQKQSTAALQQPTAVHPAAPVAEAQVLEAAVATPQEVSGHVRLASFVTARKLTPSDRPPQDAFAGAQCATGRPQFRGQGTVATQASDV